VAPYDSNRRWHLKFGTEFAGPSATVSVRIPSARVADPPRNIVVLVEDLLEFMTLETALS
jgi:hypothetical protein